MDQDPVFMARALELAALGRGSTSPNPMVGAVVVRDGAIVGEGYHLRAGSPHAEVHALRQAGERAGGATLYVSLEPCCHFGRTPPCTEAVIAAGIARVVVAVSDPNPLVEGKGVQALRQAGIEVETGVLETEARRLNEAWFKYIATGRPFVTLKAAMSLDGKIATAGGESRWITGPEARDEVQQLRLASDAILTGIGTVLADDPLLTVRLPGADRRPLRVIADSRLRIPLASQVVQTAREYPTVVAGAEGQFPSEKKALLTERGVEVWEVPAAEEGRLDIGALLMALGKREIVSLLLEGGGGLNAGALAARVVDKFIFFIAPKIIGGMAAPGPFGGEGASALAEALPLVGLEHRMVGRDLMITAYPNEK
jgi:diaminohydroxyphosphoribosylaminopyrimidine deaminase/5-amino-6-(5-phosphoribosylamino)uracil reductase